MASAVAPLKKALLVAVCVMLLPTSPASTTYSYTGQPPPPLPPPPRIPTTPPPPPACHYTGQQPPPPPACPYTGHPPPVVPPALTPTPTLVPTPMSPPPLPTPTPVPPPMSPPPLPPPPPPTSASPSPSNCTFSDCASQCNQSCNASYAPKNCTIFLEGPFNGCYESCTNPTCPGNSCAHSGCGFSSCSCNNPDAKNCCDFCSKNAVSTGLGSSYQQCQSYNEKYMGNCMTSCLNRCSENCPQKQPPPSPTPVAPAPTPTPAPAPTTTPVPPAPSPVNNCSSYDSDYCASQCDQSCRATSSAGIAKCEHSDHAPAFNACYESCTSESHGCPGKSCVVHSGCGFDDCSSCHNDRDASSCCERCSNDVGSGPDPVYERCKSSWEKSEGYCVTGCKDSCAKNCTQGA